jgi:phosphoribosylformylglycinamidine cyclo-ligase
MFLWFLALLLGSLTTWGLYKRLLPLWWIAVRSRIDNVLLGVSLVPLQMAAPQPTIQPRRPGGKITNEDAGLCKARAEEVARAIRVMTRDTHTPAVTLAEFGGIFEFDKARRSLIASTGGVGTKAQFLMKRLALPEEACNILGRDVVHNNINDILVHGGRPLFFLDYVATGRLDSLKISTLVAAMANTCKHHGCVILGGETVEVPSVFMDPDDMEIVGFVVGDLEPSSMVDGSKVTKGDVVYGLKSSGPHTNGYSLLAKLYPPGDPGLERFPELFAPHPSYFHEIYPLLHRHPTKDQIHGLVHVTGGGWAENTRRILKPSRLDAEFDHFEFSPLYRDIQRRSRLSRDEMLNTFNCGFGMLVICAPAFRPPSGWVRVGQIV